MAKSPDAFRTISEVAEWLDTPAHVLRFWESKFSQVRPVKRAGGRRYYRPDDMALLGGIKTLLHEQGMTIKGAQKLLREKGVKYVASLGPTPIGEEDADLIEATAAESVPEAAAPADADNVVAFAPHRTPPPAETEDAKPADATAEAAEPDEAPAVPPSPTAGTAPAEPETATDPDTDPDPAQAQTDAGPAPLPEAATLEEDLPEQHASEAAPGLPFASRLPDPATDGAAEPGGEEAAEVASATTEAADPPDISPDMTEPAGAAADADAAPGTETETDVWDSLDSGGHPAAPDISDAPPAPVIPEIGPEPIPHILGDLIALPPGALAARGARARPLLARLTAVAERMERG